MTSAVDRWKAAGLVEVPLPSGFKVKVLPVSPSTLILLNLAPTIVDEVLDATVAGASDEKVATDLGGSALDVAMKAVRFLWDEDAGDWVPVSLRGADALAGAFLPDDLDAVMEATLGPLNATKEGAVTLDDLRRFRDDAPGDEHGLDGEGVRPAAVPNRRARRSAARVRAGRGAGAPAGDR